MIKQLLELEQDDRLNTHPYFQRKIVSSLEFKRYLIDSILKGFPIPEIFIHTNRETGTYDVIDGQQRLNAILEYVEGKFGMPEQGPIKALNPSERKSFMEYPIAIREVHQTDEATVKEIFRRLNTNITVLTPQELRHAKFTGRFIHLAESLAEDEFWIKQRVVSQREADRMRDAEFVSELLAAMMQGPLEGRVYLTEFYEKNEEMSEVGAEALEREFQSVLDVVKAIFENPIYSWRTKGHFYSLFMAVCELQRKGRKFMMLDPVQGALLTFIRAVRDERKNPSGDPLVAQYFEACVKGGYDHKDNRMQRIKIVVKLLQPLTQ